jgi:hypothetical protein
MKLHKDFFSATMCVPFGKQQFAHQRYLALQAGAAFCSTITYF